MRRAAAGLLLLAAAAVYASCIDYFFFGRVGDDARHWLAALSVLQGRYVDLAHPDLHALGIPPPGYPLLLLPAAALGSIRLAQWMNVFFLVGGTALVLRLFRKEPALGFAAAALCALNPLTALQASPLMADPAFFAFSIAALAVTAGLLENPEHGERRAYAAALLAAACSWIRPQGMTVFGACAVALLESKATRRLGWRYAALGLPLGLFPHLWIIVRADPTTTYFTHLTTTTWRRDSPAVEVLRTVWSNLKFYASAATTRATLSWVAPVPGENSPAAFAVELLGLGLLGTQLKRAYEERGLPRLLAYYLLFYVGLHLFWTNQFRRYLFPILPALYWLALRPLTERPKALAAAAAALAAFFCAFDGVLAWHTQSGLYSRPPAGTIAFVKEHTRPGETIASRYRETFAWHTDRFAVDIGFDPDPDAWFHELTRYGVRYVVNHPEGETMESVRQERLRESARLVVERLSDPERFKPVYHADGEPFLVYELKNGDAFERGWALLAEARRSIDAGDLPGARVALEGARRTGAALVRLPFYLGTTEMLLGRGREAKRWLEEAVRREPGFLPALINLDRASSKMLN
ncbi:MAG: hypothetical protein HY925_03090 [Elusimicrobia bacterium]|nr:hypothetical protein [Elusimicrobiota bacterium]